MEKKKSKVTPEQAQMVVESIFNTPEEVKESTKKLIEKFDKGMPRATSAEVLYSRVRR